MAYVGKKSSTDYLDGDRVFRTLNTDAVIEASNLYFTNSRVLSTVLTGLSIAGGSVGSTDTILIAIGKLQNQINNIVSGSVTSVQGVENRISVTTVGTVATVDISSSYIGQTSITTLGTISAGIWNGDPINATYIKYNSTNLKNSGGYLNTIQDIAKSSEVYFNSVSLNAGLNGGTNGVVLCSNGNYTDYRFLTITMLDSDVDLTFLGDLMVTSSATISGTNTGDQTITLTGDVTGSGTSTFATTIGTGRVTNSMLAGSIDLTTKVIGILPNTSMPALSGDITNSAGSVVTTIANNCVTYGKIQQASASKLLGNPTVSSSNVTEISLSTSFTFASSTLKLADISDKSVLANVSGFATEPSAVSLGSLSETTSNVLTILNGSNVLVGSSTTIQVKQAGLSQSGYLSSVDFTTFNNKQNSLGTGTNAQYLRGDLTFQDFNTSALASVLTGFTVGTNTSILATDTFLQAFEKTQGQINALAGGTPPSGSAGGDLSGTYPNPTVAKINGVSLGTTTATSGNLLVANGAQWATVSVSGDITITSSGVTAIGSGKVISSMLANSAVTYAKIQNISTNNILLGRYTAGAGVAQEILVSTGLSLNTSTGVLTVSGAPPTGSAGGDLTGTYPSPTIGSSKVTYAKIQNISTNNILLGRYTAGAGVTQEITISTGLSLNTSTGVLTVSGAPPTGSAGGDLSGTYPNPTVAKINGATGTTAQYLRGDLSFQDFNTAVRVNRLDQMAVPTASVSLNTQKIINLLDPTNSQDAATKSYVDALAQGLSPKPSALVATTTGLPSYTYSNGASGVGATITMTSVGVVTIDGVALTSTTLNQLVLVKDETSSNAPYNGLYSITTASSVSAALVLTRSVYMDQSNEFSGSFVFIQSGTVNDNAGFVCTNSGSVVVGTTAIGFTQFSGAGSITAGAGLSKTGNTLYIDNLAITNSMLTNSSITINGTNISLGGSATVTSTATNSLTISTGLTGTSYNGSSPVTIAIDSTVVTLSGTQTISNKTFSSCITNDIQLLFNNTNSTGAGFFFYGNSSQTPSTQITITVPSTSQTLVGATSTQTLTNKTISGSSNTFSNIPNSATTATNLNTASTIVARDASGNFSAGTITASLSGNATSATTATTATSAGKWTTARNLAGNSVDGSTDVSFANKFIVQGTADSGLSGAQFLGSLSTGILKSTTTTGVLSIAVASDITSLISGSNLTLGTLTVSTVTSTSDLSLSPTPAGTGKILFKTAGTTRMILTDSGYFLREGITSSNYYTDWVNQPEYATGSSSGVFRLGSSTSYSTSPKTGIVFSYQYNSSGTYSDGPSILGYKTNSTDGDISGGVKIFVPNSIGTMQQAIDIATDKTLTFNAYGTGVLKSSSAGVISSSTITNSDIDNFALISLSKLNTQANNTLLGNNSGLTATPQALSASAVKSLLAISQSDVSGLTTGSSPSFTALTLSSFNSAGFVKNNSSGVLSGGNNIAIADIPIPDQVIYAHTETSGTDAGSFTSGAWRTRKLNTTIYSRNTSSSFSLASNQITLQAGTYYIRGWANAYKVSRHQTRFQNVTDATTAITGTNASTATTTESTTTVSTASFIDSVITIASAKTFELQHQCASTNTGTTGLGAACSFGTELYAVVDIQKLA